MGLLHDLLKWSKTTIVDLVEEAEVHPGDQFDIVELGMENGRTIAVLVVSGPHTEAVTEAVRSVMEAARG